MLTVHALSLYAQSDMSQISICISCCNVMWSPNIYVASVVSARYICRDMCKGMLNGEAGVREVKEATADCTNIAQTDPRSSLLPSHYFFFFNSSCIP